MNILFINMYCVHSNAQFGRTVQGSQESTTDWLIIVLLIACCFQTEQKYKEIKSFNYSMNF